MEAFLEGVLEGEGVRRDNDGPAHGAGCGQDAAEDAVEDAGRSTTTKGRGAKLIGTGGKVPPAAVAAKS